MVHNFGCCTSNFIAAKIIAIFATIGTLFGLGFLTFRWIIIQDQNESIAKKFGIDLTDSIQALLTTQIIFATFVVVLIADINLIIGIIVRKHQLLWLWSGVRFIFAVLVLIYIISDSSATAITFGIFAVLLSVWMSLAVSGAAREIREGETRA